MTRLPPKKKRKTERRRRISSSSFKSTATPSQGKASWVKRGCLLVISGLRSGQSCCLACLAGLWKSRSWTRPPSRSALPIPSCSSLSSMWRRPKNRWWSSVRVGAEWQQWTKRSVLLFMDLSLTGSWMMVIFGLLCRTPSAAVWLPVCVCMCA